MVLCAIGANDTYTYNLVKPNNKTIEEYVYPAMAKYYDYTIQLSPIQDGSGKGLFEVTLTNGKFSDDGTSKKTNVGENITFGVTWNDVANATGTVKISKATPIDTAIVLKAGTSIEISHKIASLKGQTPGMSISGNPPMGSKQTITAQITLEATYPNIYEYNVIDGNTLLKAECYEWTLPANWSAVGQAGTTFILGAQQKSIIITPDNFTSGAVKVRALNLQKTAGSETRSYTLDRGFSFTAFPTSISIGDNSPKTFSTTLLSGITYEWSAPFEWKINGQGNTLEGLNMNSVNITPAFCSFGDMKVRVRLKKDGVVSSWFNFPSYQGISQPTISSVTQTAYQYEDANFSLSNISVGGVNSVTWSGDGVLVLNNQGLNSKLVFTKSGTIELKAEVVLAGCSTSVIVSKSVVVNTNRLSISYSSQSCSGPFTFTINNLTSGATVAWKSNGLTPYSGIGSSFTDSSIMYAGAGYARATITIGSSNFDINQDLVLNGYVPIEGPEEIYLSGVKEYYTMPEEVVVNQWSINGVVVHSAMPNRLIIYPISKYFPGGVLISCLATSDCGVFEATKVFQIIDDINGGNYMLYPNPANNSFSIQQNTTSGLQSTTLLTNETENNGLSVVIYNDQSQVVCKQKVKENEPINIHQLRNGTYIVHITKDSKIYKTKLTIKRN